MIRVTVEMVPLGVESEKYTIASAHIANQGTGTTLAGNYRYTLWGKRGVEMARGELNNFPRQQLLSWDLLLRVLQIEYEHRNKSPRAVVLEGEIKELKSFLKSIRKKCNKNNLESVQRIAEDIDTYLDKE